MSAPDPAVLADERARNKRYVQTLADKAARVVPIAKPRGSGRANGRKRDSELERPIPQPFVGRIGLAAPHELLQTNSVYIGQWYARERDFVVISWAAPAADAFYGHGPGADLLGDVQITRVFTPRGDEIVGYDDERRDSGSGATAFDHRAALQVPRPPAIRQAPRNSAGTARPPAPSPAPAAEKSTQPRVPAASVAELVPQANGRTSGAPVPDATALRHKDALLRALTRPRQAGLQQVLATLQPQQHALVKWEATVPLVVQGHPGAGKTIVAVHRAAFLVHPAREGTAVEGVVLLVGPTENYVKHTTTAVRDLTQGARVVVRSLDALFRKLIPTLDAGAGSDDGHVETYRDFDRGLCTLVDDAVRMLERRGHLADTESRTEAAQVIYEELRLKAGAAPDEWMSYLRKLPDWDSALRIRRLAPLLAYCALASGRHRIEPPGHVIVDEAQDVRPIEWRILRLLARPDAGWTLVGDMNQRRSDHSSMSWQQSLELLDLSVDTQIEDYRSVFRSTTAILKFAGYLLPREQRHGLAVQTEGARPTTLKVRPAELALAIVTATRKLGAECRGGTVAVIGAEAASPRTALAMHGWAARAAGSDEYFDGQVTARVLSADDARGLEFDAVVVVEPADFPQNLGRHGLLYTSLTRANRSLVVVHSKPLPDELRKAPADRLE
ncbi:UvrD-helicase domain-containing protein [Modestobacter sp. VKM Ac-2984]|uniref:UvrD-helicase domain-containing protein n=1 Tax=Modestobacter sp. VKM Ac-2984 TaxID=3004138 RepID=UPI0022AB285C|nr:UvrD-helicase domain-containing protein [Modestobacter sp. VKM Ac-2984]MCZ2817913.1 AAA family ATPase [Modestobacter sp. VKM Ac-2984]